MKYVNNFYSKYGDDSTLVLFHMLNGMYNRHKGDYKSSESYFLTTISLGNKASEKNDLAFAHQEYSKLLLQMGDYKKAYENLAIYNRITDDIYDEDLLKNANVTGVNLQLDEYKREIDKIEFERDVQSQSLKKLQIIVALFVAVFLFYCYFSIHYLKTIISRNRQILNLLLPMKH